MPESEYNVSINVKAVDQTSGPAKQAAKALDELAKAAKDVRLAETLGKPSDVARAALANLDKALADGKIEIDQYSQAALGIQKSFGLVTPESQKAAQTIQKLDAQFSRGEISADEYERELKQVAQALDKVDNESQQASKASQALQSVMQGVGQAVGNMAMSAVQQLPRP